MRGAELAAGRQGLPRGGVGGGAIAQRPRQLMTEAKQVSSEGDIFGDITGWILEHSLVVRARLDDIDT